ncbi:MAG: XRE family transcriptional regulator [Deltaproteobacteria bacterium]|nr:XRE family transcriptional regulator [Deltaproteobacteria bacterium]
MKIRRVIVNNKKKSLDIETPKGNFSLPFSRLQLKPTAKDTVAAAHVDSELANVAVTYALASGKEDSVHLDAFLDYNRDPDFLRDLTLHKLTVDARRLFKKSGLSKHELIRRLKTSPSQLYRLLDPANYRKSVDEMLRLLAAMGYRVDLKLVKNAA